MLSESEPGTSTLNMLPRTGYNNKATEPAAIINLFQTFQHLPKHIIKNIRCFFVTELYRLPTAYCVTNEGKGKVYAVGQHIGGLFDINYNQKFSLIPELCDKNIEEFYEGLDVIFARSKNNHIFGWGDEYELLHSQEKSKSPRHLDYFDDKNIISVSCGNYHCLALSSNGLVYGWGHNDQGQLGLYTEINYFEIPVVIDLKEIAKNQIQSIYCFHDKSFIITWNWDLLKISANGFNVESKNILAKIRDFKKNKEYKVTDIKIMWGVIYCLTSDAVYEIETHLFQDKNIVFKAERLYKNLFECFLFERHSTYKTIHFKENQLFAIKFIKNSDISEKSVFIKTFEKISLKSKEFSEGLAQRPAQKSTQSLNLNKFRIFAELSENIESNVKCYYFSGKWDSIKYSAIIVMSDKTVYGLGCNESGELGFGHNDRITDYTPIPQLCGQNIEEFFAGSNFMFVRNDKDQIYGWGENGFGQFENDKYLKPEKVDYFDDKNVIQITGNNKYCLALSADGVVYGCDFKINLMVPCKSIHCLFYNAFSIDLEGKANILTRDFSADLSIQQFKIKNVILRHDYLVFLTEEGSLFTIKCRHSLGDYSVPNNDLEIINQIESDIKFIDIFEMECKIAVQDVECVYELNIFDKKKLGNVYHLPNYKENEEYFYFLVKTDHMNFYDFYLNRYQLIYKTIHITSDGFLITKDIKFNENYDKTKDQNLLEVMENNVFDRKFKIFFKKNRLIGRGGFGKVYEVTKISDNCTCAIKKIKMKGGISQILREVKILLELNKDFVVQYVSAWVEAKVSANNVYIQMQYCSQNLDDIIKLLDRITDQRFKTFRYFISCELFRELTECVDYLHRLKPYILHRDLKPENVLISDGSDGRFLKLCDFGLAKHHEIQTKVVQVATEYEAPELLDSTISKSIHHSKDVGTPGFIAPEVRESSKYTFKSDIYGLGITGKMIFGIKANAQQIRIKSERCMCPCANVEKSPMIFDLFSACLSFDFESRPDCSTILDRIIKLSVDKGKDLNENISEFQNLLGERRHKHLKMFFDTKLGK